MNSPNIPGFLKIGIDPLSFRPLFCGNMLGGSSSHCGEAQKLSSRSLCPPVRRDPLADWAKSEKV